VLVIFARLLPTGEISLSFAEAVAAGNNQKSLPFSYPQKGS